MISTVRTAPDDEIRAFRALRPTKLVGQVLLDQNLLVDESGYLELGLTLVSPDSHLLAYSVDRAGDEVYRLHFRDLDDR